MTEFVKKNIANELFDQVKNGDQKALEQLFSVYFLRLNDFARKIIKDDGISQDIVQDVFVKFWETRNKIQNINIEAFLFRLVRNSCIDYIKYVRVIDTKLQEIEISSKYEELYRIDFIGDEPYLLIEKELKMKIDQIVQELPSKCREVFTLSRIDGLKNREIADKLNINIKNVERHLSRALDSFKKGFSDEFPLALIILVIKSLQS
jgi:RNA polymerase sigma-70 factor (ECF subfamily)